MSILNIIFNHHEKPGTSNNVRLFTDVREPTIAAGKEYSKCSYNSCFAALKGHSMSLYCIYQTYESNPANFCLQDQADNQQFLYSKGAPAGMQVVSLLHQPLQWISQKTIAHEGLAKRNKYWLDLALKSSYKKDEKSIVQLFKA